MVVSPWVVTDDIPHGIPQAKICPMLRYLRKSLMTNTKNFKDFFERWILKYWIALMLAIRLVISP
jgi:hypothetical protein